MGEAIKILKNKSTISEREVKKVLELLKNICYGSVTLVIQDGVIIQIEKNEKIRLR